MDDIRLAERLKKHDDKALGEIILKYTALVSTIINNVGQGKMTKEDIEEVTSDVFVTLWNNAEKVHPEKLKGYICCIAKTRAINKLPSLSKNNVISLDDYDAEDNFSIEDHAEKSDLNSELKSIIAEIGEPDKEILLRYYMYYQRTSMISQVMKINIDTVKSKLRRSREKIKTKLLERGYGV